MTDRLTLIVPGNPEFVGTVRIAIAHVASRAGFDIEAIDDIKVAVSEACTNIVCHAHDNPDFTYDVFVDVEEDKLSITVQDEGVGFGMENYIEPVPGESRGSGLGIFIIKALMDEVNIDSEPGAGTRIQMIKCRI
jgi:serine/threonine-protein kinase RsbW